MPSRILRLRAAFDKPPSANCIDIHQDAVVGGIPDSESSRKFILRAVAENQKGNSSSSTGKSSSGGAGGRVSGADEAGAGRDGRGRCPEPDSCW